MATSWQDRLLEQAKNISGHNSYTLSINGLSAEISILSVHIDEQLNQPWRYTLTFTSANKHITMSQTLLQSASFTFNSANIVDQLTQIGSLQKPTPPRTVYGVITEFSQIQINKDEAHYQVVLSPRLALLGNKTQSAIYQEQSAIEVVESVLRSHGLTGVDYRLELKDPYPKREFITQWHENDLDFVLRLLADIGVWLRFESHAEHGCDVIVISDYEQGYDDIGTIVYKAPSGMGDKGELSIWGLQQHSRTVSASVQVQDYNYRQATAGMQSSHNAQQQDRTTYGSEYRYGEGYKDLGTTSQIESGSWYSQIRHQRHISEQTILSGLSNLFNLVPGQHVQLNSIPQADLTEGFIILTVEGQGSRDSAYQNRFTAIPFNVLKPYRPPVLAAPVIHGTLPAKVTSPDNDTYGYLDNHGRYRVKFNFDLKSWKSGEESLWLRLAKPYAGDTYGFHFPLIDGAEVAIAFVEGNPDRPYIAHAMHNSDKPDLVTLANKQRNVIRTPANNKLRMDDKRGHEHIKLGTEYGKTQLNMGHLVDSERNKRGEGFELRTDEWGAIRAGKGLYVTTEEQYRANNTQLQMDNALKELEQATHMVKKLNELAQAAKAELADIATQKALLEEAIKQLAQPAMVNYAPAGIASVTPASIQQTAGDNIIQTAQSSVDISAFKRFMVNAGNKISLFANKMGIDILASKGDVVVQAQNEQMQLSSKKTMKITSTDDEVIISANSQLTLSCGDVAIVLSGSGIKLIAPGQVEAQAAGFAISSPSSYSVENVDMPSGDACGENA